jgi:hypothetical protein
VPQALQLYTFFFLFGVLFVSFAAQDLEQNFGFGVSSLQ